MNAFTRHCSAIALVLGILTGMSPAKAGPVVLYTFDDYDPVTSRSVSNEGSNQTIGSADAVGNPDRVVDGGRTGVRVSNGNYFAVAAPFVPGSNSFTIVVDFALEFGDLDPMTPDRSVLFTLQGGDFAEGINILFDGIELTSAVQWGAFSESTMARTAGAFPGSDRAWHSLALVGDRSTDALSMYLDGIMFALGNRAIMESINPSQAMLIGAYRYSSARNGNPEVFTGGPLLIDEVAIWDVALNPVPTPSTFLVVAMGLIGIGAFRRKLMG